jgi:hypothetical protein
MYTYSSLVPFYPHVVAAENSQLTSHIQMQRNIKYNCTLLLYDLCTCCAHTDYLIYSFRLAALSGQVYQALKLERESYPR